jgi:precorrin-2 dehydrogenase/sirohydrochlorin ferrochelatase
MLPIVLNPKSRRIALIGDGIGAFRRFEFLEGAGVQELAIFIGNHDGWVCHAQAAVYERWPVAADLEGVGLAFVAGLERPLAEDLARRARSVGALVNVEDMPDLCDFHVPALVRRGDLLLTISTGGKAPGLASQIRGYLAQAFGSEWVTRLGLIASARQSWRQSQIPPPEVAKLTQSMVTREGWLPELRS